MSNVLSIEKLSASYAAEHGKVNVLQDVNLDMEEGEAVALMGESGIGKTTLALCILGEMPFTGNITICGAQVHRYEKRHRKERMLMARLVQPVFQDPLASLDPLRSVCDTLIEPLIIHKIGNKANRTDAARTMMARMGLSEQLLRRRPHELSGGQRQRVSLGAALMLRPKLLIADEVTSSLDKASCDDVLDLLSSLNRDEGLSILFISHDEAAAKKLCGRIVNL